MTAVTQLGRVAKPVVAETRDRLNILQNNDNVDEK